MKELKLLQTSHHPSLVCVFSFRLRDYEDTSAGPQKDLRVCKGPHKDTVRKGRVKNSVHVYLIHILCVCVCVYHRSIT